MATPENKLAFNDGWQYSPAPESTDHIKVKKKYELFIGGDFVAPEQGKYFDTINPATEKKLSKVGLASTADVDKAVKAARKAFGPWSRLKASDLSGRYHSCREPEFERDILPRVVNTGFRSGR